MKILALDLATNTGFARNYGPEPRTGSVSFEKKAKVSRGFIFDAFERWIEQLPVPDLFVIEEPHVKGMGAARVLLGLHAICEKKSWLIEKPIVFVKSRDLKLTYTGKGNADKDDMVRMAQQRGYKIGSTIVKKKGQEPKEVFDHDEADACLLLEYAIALKGAQDA